MRTAEALLLSDVLLAFAGLLVVVEARRVVRLDFLSAQAVLRTRRRHDALAARFVARLRVRLLHLFARALVAADEHVRRLFDELVLLALRVAAANRVVLRLLALCIHYRKVPVYSR